tara:strand:+ start:596 stop:1183 length:588 start_codon:yes stop_codon:yes gene_type:complete
MNKYSEYYYEVIEKYKLFHENGIKKGNKSKPGESTFLGYSLSRWILKIKEIIKINKCDSLLDFGCGKGFLYKNKFKINDQEYRNLLDCWELEDVYLYDPGVKEFSVYPVRKFDGLICTDVIEHIPESDVLQFIDNLFKLSNKFIFVVIATIPATKFFDDGNNIHLCLKTEEEWKKIFLEFKAKYPEINQYVNFNE